MTTGEWRSNSTTSTDYASYTFNFSFGGFTRTHAVIDPKPIEIGDIEVTVDVTLLQLSMFQTAYFMKRFLRHMLDVANRNGYYMVKESADSRYIFKRKA